MEVPALKGAGSGWPELRIQDWAGTRDTLHLWTQIVGKIRMAHAPMLNHWWQVTLYVTPRGLTTSSIPYGHGAFDMEFDFCRARPALAHQQRLSANVNLSPKPVAEFHAETFDALGRLGIETAIRAVPDEVARAIPFAEDYLHASYDGEAARLFWHQLIQADRLLNRFRSRFIGKVSPVHFFWGGMDLACTRFSGRPAPRHPGGSRTAPTGSCRRLTPTKSAAAVSGPAAATRARSMPTPTRSRGFTGYPVEPAEAVYDHGLGLYLLPYEAVRRAADPDQHVLQFLHSTYIAAAEAGRWDRAALETNPDRLRRSPARGPVGRRSPGAGPRA